MCFAIARGRECSAAKRAAVGLDTQMSAKMSFEVAKQLLFFLTESAPIMDVVLDRQGVVVQLEELRCFQSGVSEDHMAGLLDILALCLCYFSLLGKDMNSCLHPEQVIKALWI